MKFTGLLPAVIAITLLNPGNSSACFCSPPDFSQSIMSAKAIFSGKAVEVSPEKVVFEVEEVWKGQVHENFTLSVYQSSCHLNFKEGETYLVYALKYKDWLSGEDKWSTNQCTRTRRSIEAKEDIDRLWSLKLNMAKKWRFINAKPDNSLDAAPRQHVFHR
jgi:hypothetical protein